MTCEVHSALEWGMLGVARGILDNFLRFYVRDDGAVSYRGPETANSALLLTLLAKYYSYSRDASLLLDHFTKTKAVVAWLNASRAQSLTYPASDPRYGIPIGDSEADNFVRVVGAPHFAPATPPLHYYASAAATSRGFLELGRVWRTLGAAHSHDEMLSLAAHMTDTAALLRRDLHASMNRTVVNDSKGGRCWPFLADPLTPCPTPHATNSEITPWRSYSEMFYHGMLSKQVITDVYTNLGQNGLLRLGAIGPSNIWFAFVLHGFGFALLQHDLVSEFLLQFYAHSAHSYTRGTWTTPEGVFLDRDQAATPYSAPAEQTVPLYLRWALVFEDIDAEALWLAKALPREWLSDGERVVVKGAPTRYGRLTMELQSKLANCTVLANITLPQEWAAPDARPAGGLILRLRAPAPHTGKLQAVTVGGASVGSSSIDAEQETVAFAPAALTDAVRTGMEAVVATFGGCDA